LLLVERNNHDRKKLVQFASNAIRGLAAGWLLLSRAIRAWAQAAGVGRQALEPLEPLEHLEHLLL